MTRIQIDLNRCTKSGQCYYLYPSLVRRGEDNNPVVAVEPLDAAQRADAETMVDACPTGAIELVEEPR